MGKYLLDKALRVFAAGVVICVMTIYVGQTVSAQADQTCSANRSVNVRSGPNMSSPVTGILKSGEPVTVSETKDGWMKHAKGWTAGWLLFCGTAYKYPAGFTPDEGLIDLRDVVDVRKPGNLEDYKCFPQDYSQGDDHNRGCKEEQEAGFLWGKPRAGFNFSYNDACRDNTRYCNIQIPTWKWVQGTGEELYLPGIGSIRDPDGGAAAATILNIWEVPGEFLNAYILHGYWAIGELWDLSDMTTKWNESTKTYENDVYGSFTLETGSTLRDHFLFQLSQSNGVFRGQCGKALNCDTVTWVIALRWFDGSFRLVDQGQWVRP
jgi:hypothetical protein